MSEPLELEIITATGSVLKERIRDLFIPAFYGEAGILSNHLPYIAILKSGEISYLDEAGKRHYLFIDNGLLEVKENRIVIMADAIEKGEEMDGEELAREAADNQARIQSSFSGALTPEEVAVELDRQRRLQMRQAVWKKSRTE